MRRSAAPSQLGSASKRARFTPPFAVKPGNTNSSQKSPVSVNTAPNRSQQDVLHLIQNKSTSDKVGAVSQTDSTATDGNVNLSKTFNVPFMKTTPGNQVATTSKSGRINKYEDSLLENKSSQNVVHRLESACTPSSQSLSASTNNGPKSLPTDGDDAGADSKNTPRRMKSSGLHRSTFRQPLLQKNSRVESHQDAGMRTLDVQDNEEDGAKSHYYNVMWCKLSKKKHKKWEGDAVLITKNRSVTLLDMEGKEIGKGRGYKIKDLESMAEGQTLVVGGKEIEVMGEISEAEFTSGKCFQATAVSSSVTSSVLSAPVHRVPASKPFMNPQRGNARPAGEKSLSDRQTKPLFDPTVPGALVMPRPSATHQWEHNHNKLTLVDVVIDPYLASKLRPHQREGVQFLYQCVMGMKAFQGNGAILADDMGLGKTLQCITLVWTLYKQGPYGGKPLLRRIIVITPGSLVKNWCREFRKWLGNERIKAFDVGSDKKVEEFSKSPVYPVMVISYEMFVRSFEEIQKIKFDLIICDEGHRLKNTNIKTTSLIMSLPTRRRILLTGTPVQNDLQEFYSIVEFCNPGVLGTSGAFHRVYEDPILKSRQSGATQEEKKLGETRAAELSRLTSLFVMRRTQEINNKYLPPKVETVVFCRPCPLQLSLYHKLLGSRVIRRCLTSASYLQEASPHLVCIAALKKLCNHPCLIHKACADAEMQRGLEVGRNRDRWSNVDREEVSLYTDLLSLYPPDFNPDGASIEHSGKLQVLSQLLKAMHAGEVKERIVLVSNYTQTLNVLQKLCDMEGYQYSRLDGTTPTAKRQHIVEQFNTKYAQQTVFLLSSKAGGVGLNLIGASRLVLYDIDWNPANDLQAMARVWRDGQRKTVHIYRLITTGTLEEKVYQRQISKQGLSGAVMDAKIASQGTVKFSLEDLKDLFTLHDDATCITHDLLDCNCQDEQVATSAVQATPPRACQLGNRSTQKNKKNLSMDELMEWRHFAGPLDDIFQDAYLASAQDYITYVFQNITNSANAAKSGI